MSTIPATFAPAPGPAEQARIPRQIAYIIGNEACERFSFYGMRNILTQFLVTSPAAANPPKADAPARPRTSSTPSSSACISSRCSAAGWPTASSASTTPSSGSAWSTAPVTPASRSLNRQPHRLLRRPRPDRARLRRHQAAGGGLCGRPVRPEQQASRQAGLRRLLLDHQLRLVLRLAADADLPEPLGRPWAFGIPGILMFVATCRVLDAVASTTCMVPPAPNRIPHSFGQRGAYRADRPQGRARDGPGLITGRSSARCWRSASCARRQPGLRDLPSASRWSCCWPVRRRRHLAPARPRPRRAPRRGRRRRARGAARAGALRPGHAVLVAVRPEGLDLGPAGHSDEPSRQWFNRLADAGAQPAAGDAADSVQQPGALPGAAPAAAWSRPRCAA